MLTFENKRKKVCLFVFFIVYSLVLCSSYFNDSLVLLDDTAFHLNRISDLKDSLKNGYYLATITDKTLDGYGYANPFFYSEVFFYIPAMIHLLGGSLITSYKWFMYLITLATMIVAYLSAKNIFIIKGKPEQESVKYGLVFSMIYTTCPYRLINIFFRGAVGELLATIFLPLVFWGIYELFKEKGRRKWYLLSIGMAGIVYSHLLSLLLTSLMILFICLFKHEKVFKKDFLMEMGKAILLTIGLSAHFLFPFVEKYLSQTYYFQTYHFMGLPSENAFQYLNQPNQILLFILNLVLIQSFILMNQHILKGKKKTVKEKIYCFEICLYLLIAMTNFFPWNLIEQFPMMGQLQFPWRLFLLFSLFFALGISYSILTAYHHFKGFPIYVGMMISVVFLTFFGYSPTRVSEYQISHEYENNSHSLGGAEYLPSHFNIPYFNTKGFKIDAVEGVLISSEIKKEKGMFIGRFIVEQEQARLELPITYYKGYQVLLNNEEIDYDSSWNGLVEISTGEEKEGIIQVKYVYTTIQYVALVTTGVSVVVLRQIIRESKYSVSGYDIK